MTAHELIDYMLIAILFIVLICSLVTSLWSVSPDSPSPHSLDEQACDQMREQGIPEKKIKSIIESLGGYYEPPKQQGDK